MAISHSAKQRRARRVRAKIHGTAVRPRISVYRSNVHISIQAIDDDARTTLAAASTYALKDAQKKNKSDAAKQVGLALGGALNAKKITQAVFDRGSYRYHGRVAAAADGVRESGIAM